MTPRPSPSACAASAVLLSAPGLWLAGWAVTRATGGPTGSLLAHALWAVGFVLFAVSAVILFRLAAPEPRPARVAGLTLSLLGSVALLGRTTIDLADPGRPAIPFDDLLFSQVAPALLFVGMIVLTLRVAARRPVGLASPPLVIIGAVLCAVGHSTSGWYRVAEGLGAICVWLAAVPLAREVRRPRSPIAPRTLAGAGTVGR